MDEERQSGTPNPGAWPECSDCHVAWILRRGLSMSKGWMWVWQRDCKHKKAEPTIAFADSADV